jgi:hypothetical protein
MATDSGDGESKNWLIAAGYNASTALLVFEGSIDRELRVGSAALSLGRLLGDTWMLRGSIARVATGTITGGGDDAQVESGWMFGASLSRRFVVDGWPKLYIGGSAALAMQISSAAYGANDPASPLTAGDLRIGSTVGWLLWDRFVPYGAVRVFGGPVKWRAERKGEPVSGTDRRHFQLGTGLSVVLPASMYASAEYIPLGEQSVSAEVGVRF